MCKFYIVRIQCIILFICFPLFINIMYIIILLSCVSCGNVGERVVVMCVGGSGGYTMKQGDHFLLNKKRKTSHE